METCLHWKKNNIFTQISFETNFGFAREVKELKSNQQTIQYIFL